MLKMIILLVSDDEATKTLYLVASVNKIYLADCFSS